MISGGQMLRILEIIVTTCCGIQLGFQPCKMRWSHWAAKVMFGVLVGFWLTIEIGNTFFGKYADIEYAITEAYYFVIIFIFFDIGLLQAFVQSVFYWQSLMIIQAFAIQCCCMAEQITFFDYNAKTQPWHWIHIGTTIGTIVMSVALYRWRKGKAFVEFRHKRHYGFAVAALVAEAALYNLLMFDAERSGNIPSSDDMVFVTFFMVFLGSVGMLMWMISAYANARYNNIMMTANYQQVSKQYRLIHELYGEKRRQIHDSVQQNILLTEYLESGNIEDALTYLRDINQQIKQKSVCTYTGIPFIDFMLDYKRNAAKQSGIEFVMEMDVYFCPMEQNDMCILLGNLLDNAIEAVQNMERDKRLIHIKMRTVNQIFILRISNSYYGKRRIIDGKYQTTKSERQIHGIGLESVMQIVERYGGEMKIQNSGERFEVTVTIFKNMLIEEEKNGR
ncbi:ATP-binding protein [Ruminococcus sp. OA3]|uniref:sensor histidine kinase n=1 Tax=Ruminococcus sp. OA3 TaxID=2914164 RepID=UPI001F05EC0A|nr:ATP-binding protein [Ruminococcus sp. OA3]MCH1984507.1 ATP-binding protein [Ruminococcus sp. OA3]